MTKRRVVIKVLEDHGFVQIPSGSTADHDKYRKPGCRPVPVKRHREIEDEAARGIYGQAGIPREDWRF